MLPSYLLIDNFLLFTALLESHRVPIVLEVEIIILLLSFDFKSIAPSHASQEVQDYSFARRLLLLASS